MSREKKRKINIKRFALAVAVIGAFVLVLVNGYKLMSLEAEKKAAEKQLQALKEKQEQLEVELQEVDSKEYIEQEARAELHMIKDGELQYIIVHDEKKDE